MKNEYSTKNNLLIKNNEGGEENYQWLT